MLSYLFKSTSSAHPPPPAVSVISPISSFADTLSTPDNDTLYLVLEVVTHLWNEQQRLLVDAASLPKATLFKSLEDACNYGRALARSYMLPDPEKFNFFEHKYDNPSIFNNVVEEYQVRSFLEPASVIVRIFVYSIIPVPCSSSNDSQRTVFYSPSTSIAMAAT
jgi:hypothetical protein